MADRPVEVLVLSDTHLSRGRARRLPDEVYDALSEVDVVLHAGDILEQHVLDELAGFAPVHAVLGNNDHSLFGVLPERLVVEIGGVTVGMVHDSGASIGRAGRLHRWFPGAQLVVFGHSHAPLDELGQADQRLFNPGSATERRAQPDHTFGRLALGGGQIVRHEIVHIFASRQEIQHSPTKL
jgi:putative phosphoesterase